MKLRYDSGEIVGTRKDFGFTDEGFLQVTAIVTRTGVFNYRNADGSLRRELRHPDDVFLADSLSSMKLIPITNNHPSELVDMDNVKKYSIGNAGESVTVDGKFIKLMLTIQDRAGIDAVLNGRQELSLGYQITPVDEAGEYDGIAYDVRQTEIKYNHLAIVDTARAGSDARIKLDSGDAVLTTDEIKDSNNSSTPQTKEKKMPIFKLDGIDYEASQEVINHIGKLESKIDSGDVALATAKADTEKVIAERDTIKEKLDKAETELKPEAIKARIDSRVALERKASKVLGDEDLSKMDEKEVMVAVLKKTNDSIDLDGRSDEYIKARFDIAIEDHEDNGDLDGTREQMRQINNPRKDSGHKEVLDAEESRKKMFDKMQKRSQGIAEEK